MFGYIYPFGVAVPMPRQKPSRPFLPDAGVFYLSPGLLRKRSVRKVRLPIPSRPATQAVGLEQNINTNHHTIVHTYIMENHQ